MINLDRLTAAKKESARRTASALLGIPEAEGLMGRKKLHVLDFGYGDGVMTLGIAEAIVRTLRPKALSLAAINSERQNGGSRMLEFQLDQTDVEMIFAEPYAAHSAHDLTKIMLMAGTAGFDLITLFNPSPTGRLMRPILESNNVLMAREFGIDVSSALKMVGFGGKPLSEAEYVAQIRRVLECDYGVPLNETGGKGLMELKTAAKALALRRIVGIFPLALLGEGLLAMASDDLVPPEEIYAILAKEGFRIVLGRENDPAGIWAPSGICEYNKNLFAAVKK